MHVELTVTAAHGTVFAFLGKNARSNREGHRRRAGDTASRSRLSLSEQAVALDRDAIVRAELAARAVEVCAVRGVIHQLHPEPRREGEDVGSLGPVLIQPTAVVRAEVV